ncbi:MULTISPECIES: TetR/AcrR family transcriptional regulator [Crateriforma]|uniref:DNA-binding transcriptional repressor AcrR n=1 Tax=Crateriforma conspicua TaxID=2527996 RepID=A0A5C6FL58_9PLAN|nr:MULTISPECIES: TetR/AcrR family transcriptional regulator [Crateriforma]TWU62189.1 DNA-binding transcriptional repressor AcrR [Crateriforma conspicua]
MSTEPSETQTKILSAALDLLVRNAGKDVRMSDIAGAAGVSRQAIYLNFESRSDLMIATVQYGDRINNAASQVQPWRDAEGTAKLDAWIKFWGNYLPQIFGVAKALMIAKETDEAAAAAWDNRMTDVRNSCRKTIESLSHTGHLADPWTIKQATDVLWALLSVANYEQLTVTAKWSTRQYVKHMQTSARRLFVA